MVVYIIFMSFLDGLIPEIRRIITVFYVNEQFRNITRISF